MARLSSDANSIKRLAPLPNASQEQAGSASYKKRKSTGDAEGQPATNKRSKTKNNQDALEASTIGSPAQQQPVKRGRGRPPLGKGAAGKQGEPASANQRSGAASQQKPAKNRVGRPSLGSVTKRGRGRPSTGGTAKPGASGEGLGRGAPSGQAAGRRVSGQSDPGSAARPPPKKRGRPSLQDLPPAEANKSRPQKPGKGIARPSRESDVTKAAEEEEAEEEPPPSPPRPYAHIAPKVQYIPPSVINAKWSPLTQPSLATASALLSSSQNPILQRMSTTTNRRTHTATALKLINHRITRKLVRGLPFPPSSVASAQTAAVDRASDPTARNPRNTDAGRATELNFERVLDGLASLERQLEPALASVELLKRERAREEKQLEQDFELLRKLEAGAKNSMREKRNLLKRAHVLAPEAGAKEDEGGDGHNGLKDDKVAGARGKLFANIEDDDEVKELSVQLSGHVDSVRANLGQLGGLRDEIDRTRGVLRDALITHLSVEGYEKVVLGM